jgi:hypothetical protein
MKGKWLDKPPADAKSGDWLAVRLTTKKYAGTRWNVSRFPARMGSRSKDGNAVYYCGSKYFLTEQRVHQFWSVVYKYPE